MEKYIRTDLSARRLWVVAALSTLPMLGALAGVALDERAHLGLSTWRSACRAAGFSLSSMIVFTFELLPAAIIGLLVGGLLLQCLVFASSRPGHAANCLIAHASCTLVMPAVLLMCAFALPVPVMLITEVALTLSVAWAISRYLPRIRSVAYPGVLSRVVARISDRTCAAENSAVTQTHE